MMKDEDFLSAMIADADANRARIGTSPKAVYEDIAVHLEAGCEYAVLLSPSPTQQERGFRLHPIRSPDGSVVAAMRPDTECSLVAYLMEDGDMAARMAFGLREILKDRPDRAANETEPSTPT